MAENLFCEEQSCGLPACVFGFVDGQKRKACEEHTHTLIHKQATLYTIASFNFMQSSDDTFLYEQRKGQMQKGLGILSSLETACETSWEYEQKHIQKSCEALHEVVQQSYQEMWLRGQQSYEQMKQDIADMRSQFEQLLLDPNFDLRPEVSDLCEEIPPERLLCVIMGDCRFSVAEILIMNFQMLTWDMKREKKRKWGQEMQKFTENQVAENRFDTASQAAGYAKHFGIEGPDFTTEVILQNEETVQRLQCLFSNTSYNEAEECLKVGLSVSKTGEFETGLTELQRGRNILKGSNNWELYIQLSCTIAEIHHQRGHYKDTVEVCEHILSTWTPLVHSLEFFKALFYLIHSHIKLKQSSQGCSEWEKWAEKLITDCSHCQCISLCIEGIIFEVEEREEEEKQYLENAIQLETLPSFITIHCREHLAEIYSSQDMPDQSEETLQKAYELYSTHYPHSIQYANYSNKLKDIFNIKSPLKAEESLMRANQLYSTYFPHSIELAVILIGLGAVYWQTKRPFEAEKQIFKAIQSFSANFPHIILPVIVSVFSETYIKI